MKILFIFLSLLLSTSVMATEYTLKRSNLESRLCLEAASVTGATKSFKHPQGFKCLLSKTDKTEEISIEYEYKASADNAETAECLKIAKNNGKTSSFTTRSGLRCTLK